jgi:hypothetical protein
LFSNYFFSFHCLFTSLHLYPFQQIHHFLGAFEKLRLATISFAMSVCPSVCLHGITRFSLYGFSRNLLS